jgi:hypothetical protein
MRVLVVKESRLISGVRAALKLSSSVWYWSQMALRSCPSRVRVRMSAELW